MLKRLFTLLIPSFIVAASGTVQADEVKAPADNWQAMARRVDQLLQDRWKEEGVKPSRPSSDEEFLRRTYLDLTGRIPRVSDVHSFLNESGPDRRARLIDKLIGSENRSPKPDHPTHLATTWRKFLLSESVDLRRFGGGAAFESWLRTKFADNEPYDSMVRELILAQGQVNQSGPVLFYTTLQVKPEELAAATSRAFLGVQISCAQCHDHPFDHWTQKDFWSYAAFFAQLSRPQGQQQAFVSTVSDTNTGEVKLPETDEVVKPRYLRGEEVADQQGTTRRQKLAEWLTSKDNPYFAKATVNRVWAHMFGRGIVDPVDDLGQHNVPSHPELLDELADYFVRGGFDLRNLIRTLANTEAYQLSSVSLQGDSTPPELFARMAIKTLSAEQLYDCLEMATAKRQGVQTNGRTTGFNRTFDQNRQSFINKFRAPAGSVTEYQAGIPQALTLMNGALIGEAIDLQRSDILVSLQAPFLNDRQRVESLFLATLSRLPYESEHSKFVSYVTSKKTDQEKRQALSDVLWALLNSAEFTLNH